MRFIKTFILTSVVFITSSLTVKAQIISDLPANSMSYQSFNETNPKTIESEISSFDFDNNDVKESLRNQKVIYFELLGNGGFYSVNYEHFIRDRVSLRGGVSYMFHTKDNLIIDVGGLTVVPISINRIMHIKGDSFFETSIGPSFGIVSGNAAVAIVSGIGFREQPTGKGTFTRVTLNPLLYFDDGARFGITAGISLGFSFK